MICKSYCDKNTTSRALIHHTDKMREQLGKGNFSCGICVNSQKLFDSVDHDILIQKLNVNGTRGTANIWFFSYLENRTRFIGINVYSSDLHFIRCRVPQGSILRPLLLLAYINDLDYASKHCKVHHLADDTNLLNFNQPSKKMNKWLIMKI